MYHELIAIMLLGSEILLQYVTNIGLGAHAGAPLRHINICRFTVGADLCVCPKCIGKKPILRFFWNTRY